MKAERLPRAWWAAVLTIATLGAFLRYRDLSRQIVLDDEWHSLAYASSHDAWSLLTTYYPNATSIPINVYHRLLLVTWGWSEVSIRLLSIVATLAALLLVPWVVTRVFRSKAMGLVAGVLFACSPFWTFYGASARPYAAFFALLWLALYFLLRVLERAFHADTGARSKAWDWLWFGISGALAVWFHLYALPALAATIVLPVVRALRLLRAGGLRARGLRELAYASLLAYGSWTALVLLLYAAPAQRGMADKLPIPPAPHGYDLQFLQEAAGLVSGARALPIAALSCVAAAFGLVLAAKRNRDFVALVGLGAAAALGFTLLLKPDQYYVALVTCRYDISIYFLYFIGFSAVLERGWAHATTWLASRAPKLPVAATAASALAALTIWTLWSSPLLRQLALAPNNFRLHSAFQERYGAWDPTRGYDSVFGGRSALSAARIRTFYTDLAGRERPCTLVEYPLSKRDHENPYYFYQLHHRCEVVAGYSRHDPTGERLGAVEHASRLKFARLVDVEDVERLQRSGAQFLIVHADPRAEATGARRRASRETKRVLSALRRRLGTPVYSDRAISVFAVRPGQR